MGDFDEPDPPDDGRSPSGQGPTARARSPPSQDERSGSQARAGPLADQAQEPPCLEEHPARAVSPRLPDAPPPRGPSGAVGSVCVPLLKFGPGGGDPCVCPEGLAALASLPAPVSVVTFLGDGRCGKSTLASRIIDDERQVFPVGDTGEPVTVGIDMYVQMHTASADVGTLVILDCEGGNNPTGAFRSAVDLVAMFVSTLTVQVVFGQMSEMQLQQIGHVLAMRDRNCRNADGGAAASPQAQELLLVVNGCHLKYPPGYLGSVLQEAHEGREASRNELRARIKQAYAEIHFCTLPLIDHPSYGERLSVFRRSVGAHCTPAKLADIHLSGLQVAEMIKSVVAELCSAGMVPVPSVFRHVIFDHFLVPLVSQLTSAFEQSLPGLDDEEYKLNLKDTRSRTLQEFDEGTRRLTSAHLVADARLDLVGRIDAAWDNAYNRNLALGEQVRDLTTECEVRFSHTENRHVGYRKNFVCGKRAPVYEPCNMFRQYTRSRVLKKNGACDYTEWTASAVPMEIPHSTSRTHSMSQFSQVSASMSSTSIPTLRATGASPLL